MNQLVRLAASTAILSPSAAWAHGEHGGAAGIVHLVASFDHLGLAMLAGAGALLLGQRISGMLRRSMDGRGRRAVAGEVAAWGRQR